jgi:hypothetical protein
MRWQPTDPLQRLLSRIEIDQNTGCWEWQGYRRRGYGSISLGRRGDKTVPVHRLAYERLVGPIPDGLQLDHLCRNPPCCNPEHLEPVTSRVNTLRGVSAGAKNAVKTHCPQGHEYTPENTYLADGARHCRICRRIHWLGWRERQREKRNLAEVLKS